MISELRNVNVSEPLLQSIMHEYIDKLRSRKSTDAERLQIRWETDRGFYANACKALSEAIVFSTLAGAASKKEDFLREAKNLAPIDDSMISMLRSDVFKAGVDCVVETIGEDVAKVMNVAERVEIFRMRTST